MNRNIMREIREAHNYTQKEMAEKIGLSLPSVKRLEKDAALPTAAAVKRNLKALATLAGMEVETEPSTNGSAAK
jgi:transcriptional regulator with XRE-family HTH domain